MRLLELDAYGELSLTKNFVEDIPHIRPYAILSHTWGEDDDEVTFNDLQNKSGKSKAGYATIQFCGEQARKDGLQYFWVDTCCINKPNYTELSEAINSMFRWYRNAAKCYVYLSDVSACKRDNDDLTRQTWELAFQKSKWFTRGWTLQELLAPKSVEFFSREGERLDVPITALRGAPLPDFRVDERLRWAGKRDTKRREDKAYCLLGIFNVFIPPIYGEGENALIRLKEEINKSLRGKFNLERLPAPPASSKSFGVCWSQAPQIEPDAFIGRAKELKQLQDWLLPTNHPRRQCIVSVVGMGGMGKTQLSLAHVRDCADEYSSVFWVNAKDETILRQNMVDLSEVIFHDSATAATQSIDDEKLKVDKVRRWLSESENDQWLLIFDNYDDPHLPGIRSPTGYDIRSFFPTRSQGSIMITSRCTRLTFSKRLNLQKLEDINTSVSILSQRSGRDFSHDRYILDLARHLDGLPLALATAGAYLGRAGDTSCNEYLELYNSRWMDLVGADTEELLEYEARTMSSTWAISLDQVRSQDEDAAELLTFLAYLSNRDVWYELIKAGVHDDVPWMGHVTESKIHFQRAMSKLHDYNLVDVVAGSYQVHPCLHDWLVGSFNTPPNPTLFITALRCIANSVADKLSPQFWVINRRLLEHTERLESPRFSDVSQLYASEEMILDVVHRSAGLQPDRNQHEKAEQMYMRALAGYEKALGPDHTSTLTTVNNLGNLYHDQDKLEAAAQMYVRALAGREKALGPDHTSTLTTVHNLGNLYRDQGKLEAAKQIYMRALAENEKIVELL